jgi:hypothetical protein
VARPVTQNPVIEKLVNSAVERCRERITAAKAGGGTIRNRQQAAGSGITRSMKLSHGL